MYLITGEETFSKDVVNGFYDCVGDKLPHKFVKLSSTTNFAWNIVRLLEVYEFSEFALGNGASAIKDSD